jgi:hypothetical protein
MAEANPIICGIALRGICCMPLSCSDRLSTLLADLGPILIQLAAGQAFDHHSPFLPSPDTHFSFIQSVHERSTSDAGVKFELPPRILRVGDNSRTNQPGGSSTAGDPASDDTLHAAEGSAYILLRARIRVREVPEARGENHKRGRKLPEPFAQPRPQRNGNGYFVRFNGMFASRAYEVVRLTSNPTSRSARYCRASFGSRSAAERTRSTVSRSVRPASSIWR